MNKTIESLLRGYVLFDVNGQRFYRYNTALEQRKATQGDVEFKGWHIFKGWRTFFLRVTTKAKPEQPKVRTGNCLLTGVCASEGHKIQPKEPQRKPLTDEQRTALRDAFAQALTSVYVCGRVWEAWQYGTMSEGDFQPASECEEVLDSIIEAAHGIMSKGLQGESNE